MRSITHITSVAVGVMLTMTTLLAHSDDAQNSSVQTTIVNPPTLYDPAPNGYSHAVVATGGSKLAFIAGQGGEDAHGALAPDFEGQLRQAYANLFAALDAVGAEPHHVTRITTYVVEYDQSKLGLMTEVVTAAFGDSLPAQTLVPVSRLAIDGMLFEVDAIAVID